MKFVSPLLATNSYYTKWGLRVKYLGTQKQQACLWWCPSRVSSASKFSPRTMSAQHREMAFDNVTLKTGKIHCLSCASHGCNAEDNPAMFSCEGRGCIEEQAGFIEYSEKWDAFSFSIAKVCSRISYFNIYNLFILSYFSSTYFFSNLGL